MQSSILAPASLRNSSTTQSAVNRVRSARSAMAFSIAAAMSGFVRFSWPITRAVLAL